MVTRISRRDRVRRKMASIGRAKGTGKSRQAGMTRHRKAKRKVKTEDRAMALSKSGFRRMSREKPVEIRKTEGGLIVQTTEGEYPADGVFVLREAVAPAQLVPGLETDGAHVKVNRKMETNLPGVFACGDLAGTPYQYVKAAGEGNVAAISAAAYLDRKQ